MGPRPGIASRSEAHPVTIAVVAEKPSVARDIARVLGASRRGDGHLAGAGYVVTWAIGHLVRLAEPPEIRPEWKRWAAGDLPLLPSEWPLVVAERTQDQFRAVKKVLRDPDITGIVCATDAGREGELIFRYILEAAGCRKPVRRLWISSLTPEAIRRGFASLRPLSDYDPLAASAHARARADWLVGMNLSRAATLAHGELFSVGRVQTPTLALLVEREKAIRAFVPEEYLEVEATFGPEAGTAASAGPEGPPDGGLYRGTWFRGERPTPEARRLPKDGAFASAVVERVRGGGRRWSRSSRRRAAFRRLCSTTSPSCSATRTGSMAFPRRRRWPSRRRSTKRRSSSPTRAPTAGTSRATWRRGCPRWWPRSPGPTRRSSPPGPEKGRWAGASWTTRRSPTTTPSFPPPCLPPASP